MIGFGYALSKTGKIDEAISTYRAAIKLEPGNGQAHMYLGGALSQKGQHEEAVAALREAVRLAPKTQTRTSAWATRLRQPASWTKQSPVFGRGSNANPLTRRLRCTWAALFRERECTTRPLAFCARQPGSRRRCRRPPQSRLRAFFVGQAGRSDFELSRGNSDRSRKCADSLVPRERYLHQRKLDDAVAAYREAIRLKPDDAEIQLGMGYALQTQEKLDEAVAAFREAIRLKPDYAEAHSYLGNAYLAQEKFDDAVIAFREAIRLKPDDSRSHFSLGYALQLLDKLDEAAAEYREAIRLEPNSAQAHFNLGTVLAAQEKFDEAEAEFAEARRLDPDIDKEP